MDLRSSQSDINSQGSRGCSIAPCGVITIPSPGNAIPNANTNASASRYPSVASPPHHNSKGHNSASCSFNNHSAYDQQQIASLLSAVGTLHLVVAELKADQDTFRNESESTIRALSKQAKESEKIIAVLRTKIERLETTMVVRQPSSWNAKGCDNLGRREPCNQEPTNYNEEEKDESDVDDRPFVHRRSPIPQSKDEERLVVTTGAKRIDSRGIETSRTEWESESDSDHQPRGVTQNERREGDCSSQSPISPPARAAPATTSGFDGGNARSLITDATSMMHSEGHMGETIESTADDPLDEDPKGASHRNLRQQFMYRNSSMRCIGNYKDLAAPDPIICCDESNPVLPQSVPAEIEVRPSTSHHHTLLSVESSLGAGAARMPNRSDDSVSLISDISFYNANHNTTTTNTGDNNGVCSTWTDNDMTRTLEDLRLAIEETRRVSRGGDQIRLHGKGTCNEKLGFHGEFEGSQSRLLSNLENLNASFTKISNSMDADVYHSR